MSIWFIAFLVVIIGGMLYIRFVPIDTSYYIQSPKSAPSDGKPHEYRLVDKDGPVYDFPANELEKRVSDYITNDLHGKRIDEGKIPNAMTFEVRTKLMGYRDYVSIEIDPIGEKQSRLNILSRSHFGTGDMGANKARVEKILSALSEETS